MKFYGKSADASTLTIEEVKATLNPYNYGRNIEIAITPGGGSTAKKWSVCAPIFALHTFNRIRFKLDLYLDSLSLLLKYFITGTHAWIHNYPYYF